MLKKSLLMGAALTVAAMVSAPASANLVTVFSGFTTAFAPSGLTPIVGFSSPAGTRDAWVTVTDCCIVGDYYATYVDGVYLGTTPFVPINGSPLSSATFETTLTGGLHNFQLQDQILSILPAGVQVTITVAPEPSTWVMMGLGFAGLAFMGYRASRKTAAVAA